KGSEHRLESIFSSDLTILKTSAEILDRAQIYATLSTKKTATHVFRLPPALANGNRWASLIVPVDHALEARARKLIASPQDFAPRGVTLDVNEEHQLRYAGVTMLRHFKSDANAEILRAVAKEPMANFMIDFQGPYSIQKAAYEILLSWNKDAPPKWRDKV